VKDKIFDFFLAHGFKVMMTGFSLSVIGLLLYIKMQRGPGHLKGLGFTLVATGMALYIIGRISVIAQNRRDRKVRRQEANDSVEKGLK
jgi:hypothetical protein